MDNRIDDLRRLERLLGGANALTTAALQLENSGPGAAATPEQLRHMARALYAIAAELAQVAEADGDE